MAKQKQTQSNCKTKPTKTKEPTINKTDDIEQTKFNKHKNKQKQHGIHKNKQSPK